MTGKFDRVIHTVFGNKFANYHNLNEIPLIDDNHYFNPSDHSKYFERVDNIDIYFKDIKNHLLNFINSYKCIVGCIAWLTDFDILDALSEKDVVSIVVQKEDFLRPDMNIKWSMSYRDWALKLREKYENLPMRADRYDFPIVGRYSVCSSPELQPVRCVGNYNSEKKPAFPRMHNKFIIGGHMRTYEDLSGCQFEAESVWNGSFNFTYNARNSFENAQWIRDRSVAGIYYDEWAQIMLLSEPLNWSNAWIEPEWRIGT